MKTLIQMFGNRYIYVLL